MIEILVVKKSVFHLILFEMIFIHIWLVDNLFGVFHETKIHIFSRFVENLHVFLDSGVYFDR